MAWIEFLPYLRATGMPIRKMQAFARLRSAGDPTLSERKKMLEQHLAEVQAEVQAGIEVMQQSAAVLQARIVHYREVERLQDLV